MFDTLTALTVSTDHAVFAVFACTDHAVSDVFACAIKALKKDFEKHKMHRQRFICVSKRSAKTRRTHHRIAHTATVAGQKMRVCRPKS